MNTRYVLLVDDEQNILMALKRELNDWAYEHNLEILTAGLAKTGLEILLEKGDQTVVVISDLKMPQMKGSDFLQIVRDTYPGIVTILLTGFSETEEVIKAVRAGIFNYILKPWDSEYLLSEVEKAFVHGDLKRQNEQYLKTMQEELKWAGEMQKAILKPMLPKSEIIEFRVSYRPIPTLYCGGNYYDVISISPDKYLLLIGDVGGSGVRAAFVTGILKSVIFSEYVRNTIGKNFSPGDFLGWLNTRMNFELRQISGITITFFAGVIDLKNKGINYANAGQSHPFILRGGAAIELPVTGKALGYASTTTFAEQYLPLQPFDIITLYTDGLTEFNDGKKSFSIKPIDIFNAVPYSSEYHRKLMLKALELVEMADFSTHLTILSARLL